MIWYAKFEPIAWSISREIEPQTNLKSRFKIF